MCQCHGSEFDITTGALTPWNPGSSGSVLAVAGNDSVVYAGGFFTSIGGKPRNHLAALYTSSGMVTAWNPNPNGTVRALVEDGSTGYLVDRLPQAGDSDAVASFVDAIRKAHELNRDDVRAVAAEQFATKTRQQFLMLLIHCFHTLAVHAGRSLVLYDFVQCPQKVELRGHCIQQRTPVRRSGHETDELLALGFMQPCLGRSQ